MKLFPLFLAAAALAAEQKLGAPLQLKSAQPVSAVLAQADTLAGKTVQVKGKVTEVCQMMGCWMALVDPATKAMLRIKVNDGEIVFPKDSVGRMAVAEGTLKRLELSKDQAIARARHEAEEQGRQFDPATVKGPQVVYQVQGTGAVLLD